MHLKNKTSFKEQCSYYVVWSIIVFADYVSIIDFGGLLTGTHLLALVVGVGLGILLTTIVVCFLKKCRAKESAAEKEDGPVIYDDVIVNCKRGGGQIETKTNEAYEMASSRL